MRKYLHRKDYESHYNRYYHSKYQMSLFVDIRDIPHTEAAPTQMRERVWDRIRANSLSARKTIERRNTQYIHGSRKRMFHKYFTCGII